MGCLVNLIKIFLGLIMIAIMLIVGYKLIFDPYRPESPNSSWSHRPVAEQTYSNPERREPKTQEENYDFRTNVPVQVGENHDYIMENTIQKGYVVMELTPALERGLVYVIKCSKASSERTSPRPLYPPMTPSIDMTSGPIIKQVELSISASWTYHTTREDES